MNGPERDRRTKILFVCAQNKIRSVTAEKMFAGSQLYDVKSRGVAKDARIKLTAADLRWADLIFVMEKNHRNRIAKDYRLEIANKKIVCLFVEDIYEPMEESLIAILRQKLAPTCCCPREPMPSERIFAHDPLEPACQAGGRFLHLPWRVRRDWAEFPRT